ncbi:hypothetical protein MOO44_00510 (plasmid) [Nicoliella spurrieriana]|uniref:Uncharacterized protein n=1 Tax=Nicoliella spurrieriana TaxID=2925830 RepID=A0A976X4N8_9LACO|nr:hypothetical protein [Nicoliella spurrieriana]UQS86158.1 hypothetical protein MOO44_00510 [Nicoliella spurrieriana]
MDHPFIRAIFNFVNIQGLLLLIFLFINIGFESRSKHQEVQSDGLSNFILILALCESLNFLGNAILRDFFIGTKQITIVIGVSVIVISWITAISFTIWNFFYLRKLSKHVNN